MSHITNQRMEAFCEAINAQVKELLAERGDDMLKAWNENIEEAQANDAKFPPLKISIGSTVDIEAAKIETVVSFAVKYTSKLTAAIEDPDQLKLPIDNFVDAINKSGVDVEISFNGKEPIKIGKKK